MKPRYFLCLLLAAAAPVAAQTPPKAVKPAPPPAEPPSFLVVSCDPGGCWDEFGVRYDAAGGGVFIRRDGASCQQVRGRMQCK